MDKPKVIMRRLHPRPGDSQRMVNLSDIAYDLAEEYASMQPAMDGWQEIPPERFAIKLEQVFSMADLSFLQHMHVGKGVLIGAVIALCTIEDSIQEQIDDRLDGEDPDAIEDLTDEEIEGFVLDGVLGFGNGETGDGNEQ